jgi:hypothetical protein
VSHYTEVKLSFNNRENLIAALVECGVPREHIEVYDTPQLLEDYCGHHTKYRYQDTGDKRFINGDCGHVTIKRHNVGEASNDISFYIDEGGDSVAFVSDYDRSGKYGDSFLPKLTQRYATLETKAEYADAGKEVIEQVHEGRVYLYVKAG